MERPSLDRYREILDEEGIDLPQEELRALREQVELLAEVIVDLYVERQRRPREMGHGGRSADTVSGNGATLRTREEETRRRG
jgi:hypothetical protein